jgi:hypothetical protein
MTAVALFAGPTLGCKSEKTKEAEVEAPATVETDEPFVLHLVEVTVREVERDQTAADQQVTATAGQDDGEMKPLSHARKELQQLEKTVDELAPRVAENLEEAADFGNFIEVTDGVRISGEKKIELPRSVKVKMDAWDQTEADITTRVCVSTEGVPTSVVVLDSSGFDEADQKVKETILNTWRYRPYLANGQPIPVCERITFRYQLPHADTTKPVLF